LSVSSVVILSLLQERATLSHSFLKRHVGPVKAMVMVHVVSQAITVVFRVYVYVQATIGETACSEIFHHGKSWYIWMMMVYRLIDVVIPQWAILGYFYKTVVSHNSSTRSDDTGTYASVSQRDTESEAEWWNSLDRTRDDDEENDGHELNFGFGRPPAPLHSNIYTTDDDIDTGLTVSYNTGGGTGGAGAGGAGAVGGRPSLAFKPSKPHQVTTEN